MDIKTKILLEKYYNGETSLEEEALLKQLFTEQEDFDVSADTTVDKDLMRMLSEQPKVDDKLIIESIQSEVDKWQQSDTKHRKRYASMTAVLSSAATIALAIGFTLFFTAKSNTSLLVDTYDDPQLALLETQRVLALIGSKINRAKDELEPLSHLQTPQKSFKTFDRLSKNISYLNMVESIGKTEY